MAAGIDYPRPASLSESSAPVPLWRAAPSVGIFHTQKNSCPRLRNATHNLERCEPSSFFFCTSPHFPRTMLRAPVGSVGIVPLIGHRLAYFQCCSPQSPAGGPMFRHPGRPDTLRNGGKGPASREGEILREFARSRWLPRLPDSSVTSRGVMAWRWKLTAPPSWGDWQL